MRHGTGLRGSSGDGSAVDVCHFRLPSSAAEGQNADRSRAAHDDDASDVLVAHPACYFRSRLVALRDDSATFESLQRRPTHLLDPSIAA
jgi:hypothetical protein